MTVTTNRGQTFDVNWAWADESQNRLMIELKDEARSIEEIASAFDGLDTISRESEEEGDATYNGYDTLLGVVRNLEQRTALITITRSTNGKE